MSVTQLISMRLTSDISLQCIYCAATSQKYSIYIIHVLAQYPIASVTISLASMAGLLKASVTACDRSLNIAHCLDKLTQQDD